MCRKRALDQLRTHTYGTHTYIGHLGSPPHTHTEVKESVICFNIKCVTNCKKYERVVQCLMRTHFVTNEGVHNGLGEGEAAETAVVG